MSLAQRLRHLDDRVLGPVRPPTARSQRTLFLVGLVGTLALAGVALVRDESSFLSAAGGFIGVTLAAALRWYVSLPRASPWRAQLGRRLLLVVAGLTLVGLVVGVFVRTSDDDGRLGPPAPRQCVELRAEAFNGLADAEELAALQRCPTP